MHNFDEIIYAAQQLAKAGKEPTVALLKSCVKAPLPAIIKGLKMWQQNPDKEIQVSVVPADIPDEANDKLNELLTKKLNASVQEQVACQLEAALDEKLNAKTQSLTDEIDKLKQEVYALKQAK